MSKKDQIKQYRKNYYLAHKGQIIDRFVIWRRNNSVEIEKQSSQFKKQSHILHHIAATNISPSALLFFEENTILEFHLVPAFLYVMG
jgi:hypothetical protein